MVLGFILPSFQNMKSLGSHSSKFGKVFQDRVLQTIASSPQDSSLSTSPQMLAHLDGSHQEEGGANLSTIASLTDPDSDSGCSTSDDDCDTMKPSGENSRSGSTGYTNDGSCDCDYKDAAAVMFPMESIDLDMIEND